MIGVPTPAAETPRLPADRVDPEYRRLRRQVFVGIFVGYAAYYLVRNNLALAIPDILLRLYPEYTKAALGTALTGLSIAYGVSKFLMGSVSDRSNPRYFLPLGLLLSAAIIVGVRHVQGDLHLARAGHRAADAQRLGAGHGLAAVRQDDGALVQHQGARPDGVDLERRAQRRRRARRELRAARRHAVRRLGRQVLLQRADCRGRRGGSSFFLLRDTPQSCGLPPIEEYQNDYPPDYSADHERTFTFREIFFEHVLNNRYLWAIAVANAFVYFVRYGVVNWIPTYLQTAKGFSFQQSSLGLGAVRVRRDPGHDRLRLDVGHGASRAAAPRRTILFMALTLVAVVVYWLNIHGPLWIDYAALIAIGFLIYGPIMIIGLHALDLVPKKAAGTAAGFTGFFGYVFGSAIAGTGVGWIADHWGWNGVFVTMVACCLLTIAFSALTLGHRTTSGER